MNNFREVKNRILAGSDMDYVGICPSSVLEDEPEGHRPSDLLPNAKSIIIYGRNLIDGSVYSMLRNIEDGIGPSLASYSAHSFVLSINHLCMNETYNIAQHLEKTYKVIAMPLTNNVLQGIQPEGNYLPFFADPYEAGLPINIYKAAVAAGIGELGWNHRIITPQNGPRVYLCGIITNMEFKEYDKPYAGEKLCKPEKCRICSKVCPVNALSDSEVIEIEINGKKYQMGKLNVNGCAAACFGFKKALNPRSVVFIEEDYPNDEMLAAALKKQFKIPGIMTLDHIPMFHCDRCMIYCPVGNRNEKYSKHKLLNKLEEEND